mmetsp:Transcript_52286/g.138109  ORF Transcript_52286/g.138109 Transcript_52286/m.138109 type:complete len:341 (-) Transcript_52286:42-1064(-)
MGLDADPDEDPQHPTWLLAPVVCVVVLTAGVVAGVVRALRQGGRAECGGIPLPRCHWLTSRWAVRISAWGALIAGLAGLLDAAGRFRVGWYEEVPPYLLGLTLATYLLFLCAPTLSAVSLRWREQPQVYMAFRQAAKAALLGGLAGGLASEVLCNAGESQRLVSPEWRQGCAMLGASSGLLLLGLYAAQADGEASRAECEGADEAVEDGHGLRGGTEDSDVAGIEESSARSPALQRSGSGESDMDWPPRRPSWSPWPQPGPDLDWRLPGMPRSSPARMGALGEGLLQSQAPWAAAPEWTSSFAGGAGAAGDGRRNLGSPLGGCGAGSAGGSHFPSAVLVT